MKKKWTFLLVIVMLLGIMTGCGELDDDSMKIYYLNMDMTCIKPEKFEVTAVEDVDLANEMLERLQSQPENGELCRTIPSAVTVNGCLFNGNSLVVDFSKEYYDMGMTDEVLTRAAIVRTLLQIKDITFVYFTVDSEPLTYPNGQEVGVMNSESFVENPGDQINSSVQTKLTLYFASDDGTYLKKETRTVRHSSNIAMDKLVVEQLIAGPKSSGLQSTIPSGTRVVTVSTVDGVCYVSLNDNFKNQNPEVTESTVLYSIVNSLTELPDVQKVQISVNGDTTGKCRYDMDLSVLYEFNKDAFESSKKKVEETDTELPESKDNKEEQEDAVPAEAGVSTDIKTRD